MPPACRSQAQPGGGGLRRARQRAQALEHAGPVRRQPDLPQTCGNGAARGCCGNSEPVRTCTAQASGEGQGAGPGNSAPEVWQQLRLGCLPGQARQTRHPAAQQLPVAPRVALPASRHSDLRGMTGNGPMCDGAGNICTLHGGSPAEGAADPDLPHALAVASNQQARRGPRRTAVARVQVLRAAEPPRCSCPCLPAGWEAQVCSCPSNQRSAQRGVGRVAGAAMARHPGAQSQQRASGRGDPSAQSPLARAGRGTSSQPVPGAGSHASAVESQTSAHPALDRVSPPRLASTRPGLWPGRVPRSSGRCAARAGGRARVGWGNRNRPACAENPAEVRRRYEGARRLPRPPPGRRECRGTGACAGAQSPTHAVFTNTPYRGAQVEVRKRRQRHELGASAAAGAVEHFARSGSERRCAGS